ncbi:Serine carboxypeptidase-like 51, partial [Zea mays]
FAEAGRILEAGVAASHWWGEQSDDVFDALAGDFMKPRIQEVDQLLKLGVNVTVYSGHVDLIWATKGTMDWVQKLKLDGLNSFLSSPRTPIYCNKEGQSGTQAFVKSYKNLNFYWILEAGHMVINEWYLWTTLALRSRCWLTLRDLLPSSRRKQTRRWNGTT